MSRFAWFLWTLPLVFQPGAFAQNTDVFDLRDGDRVVFLGDTFFEREQSYGHIEYLLSTRYPNRNVTFRNLGWSADTPLGLSRSGFGFPDEGFHRLKTNDLALVRPTVAFLSYGMTGSFAGEAGLPKFISGMEKLMDVVQEVSGTNKVRFVLLGPIPHERHLSPLPDPSNHAEQLQRYTVALKDLAARRNAPFIDLLSLLDPTNAPPNAPLLTDNGIHLTDYGYRRAAEAMAIGLGWDARGWHVGILPNGRIREGSYGTTIHEVSRTDVSLRLITTDDRLMAPRHADAPPLAAPPCRIQVTNLKPGRYDLKIDGQFIRSTTDVELRDSLVVDRGPQWEQAEQLRQTILKKNELFFHRYRPQNNTYLFLFRKHEQGQNAKEIPAFDPLIAEHERLIASLRKPNKQVFEILPSTATNSLPATVPKREEPAFEHTLPPPSFDLDQNIEITLWAENPLLAKPIHINFDPQGRLWVASSEVYPQIKPGQEAVDKILVLADTDGDGHAEESTVFVDGLLIPTGVEPGDGGVYVGQSTELLHFKDTNGDGKADERRVVLSGFGTEDTHHIVHTLRWSQDGQLCLNQSIYIHTHTETPHGVIRLNSGGILNLRPGTMELGILMKGLVNSWGHAIDRFGQSFATDGAGGEGINWIIPQAMYVTYERARRILGSVSPGAYPKFCGLEILHSQHFPDEWQGNFITCDFRAHRVVRFGLEQKDSAYITREMPDLIRTKDVAFRPIDVKLGPDGALYIADWSNPIIQHGEVDFRDPRRDHEHGRIWRVTYKNRSLAPRPNLVAANTGTLFDQLLSSNDFNRNQARRVLLERGATNVLPALKSWAVRQTNEQAKLEALWLYQALDLVQPDLLEDLLNANDGRIRAAAVRVLAQWTERKPLPATELASASRGWPPVPLPMSHRLELASSRALELLTPRVADEHPRVRMEALRALARIPAARSVDLALTVLDGPLDNHLEYALWLTMNDLAEIWVNDLKAGNWKIGGREHQLEYGLKAIESAQASDVLVHLLGDRPLPRDGSSPWIDLIGRAGTSKELTRLFQQARVNGFDDETMAKALGALNAAARLRSLQPTGDLQPLTGLLTHPSEPVRLEAARLAGAWKGPGDSAALLLRLVSPSTPTPALRDVVLTSLREIGGPKAADALVQLTTEKAAPEMRRQAATALAAIDLKRAVPTLVELLSDVTVEADALALWRSLLNIKGAASVLAKALPKSGLNQTMAKAGLRVAREGGRNEPDLVLALSRGAELDQGEVTLTEAELKQLVTDVQKAGDPVRGEIVYRRKELSCVACHSIGGAGGKVGPDMTSIGASAPVDYLIESVWFPNKKIKEGYHAVMVETKDGQEFSGTLLRETGEQLILRDASDKEVPIARNNVQDQRMSTLSLMPAGLIDGITSAERVDLFRFLSELGKPGPFDASKGNVARAWKLRPGIHVEEQKIEGGLPFNDLNGRNWLLAYSNVDGRVPANVLREGAVVANKYIGVVALYAVAQFEMARATSVKLRLTGGDDASLWIDGKPVPANAELTVNLGAGSHTVAVRLDPKKLPDFLKLEASEGTFVVP